MSLYGTAIIIYPDGHQERISLRKPTIRLGRAPDNDIILTTGEIAQHHAQIFCSASGFQIFDLNSDEGTTVDNTRISSYYPQPLADDSVIQIGELRIFLYPSDEEFQDVPAVAVATSADTLAIGADSLAAVPLASGDTSDLSLLPPAQDALRSQTAEASANGNGAHAQHESAAPLSPFEVSIFPIEMVVDPGGAVIVVISILNRSSIMETIGLRIEGPPTPWATITPASLPLFPNAKGEAQLVFFPPADTPAQDGPLPFNIIASSKHNQSVEALATGVLTLRVGAPTDPPITPPGHTSAEPAGPAAQSAALPRDAQSRSLEPAPGETLLLPETAPPLSPAPLEGEERRREPASAGVEGSGLEPAETQLLPETSPSDDRERVELPRLRRKKRALDDVFSQIGDAPAADAVVENASSVAPSALDALLPARPSGDQPPAAPSALDALLPARPTNDRSLNRTAAPDEVLLPRGAAQPIQPMEQGAPAQKSVVSTTLGDLPVNLTVSPGELVVNAGEQGTLSISMLNRSSTLDRINLSVEGLPAAWVTVTRQNMPLFPGLRGEGQIILRPPREPGSSAGPHPFNVVARLEQRPDEQVSVAAQLVVLPFSEFKLGLFPRETTGRRQGSFLLVVTNAGNAPRYFQFEGRDEGHHVAFEFGMPTMLVGPGESRQVPLRVRLRTWRWLSGRRSFPFAISVSSEDKELQEVRGTLHHLPPLPRAMLGRELAPAVPHNLPAEALLVTLAGQERQLAPLAAAAAPSAASAPVASRAAQPLVEQPEPEIEIAEPAEPPPPPEPLVHLNLEARQLIVEPGQMARTVVTLTNRSSIVDRVELHVEGIPHAWVRVIPEGLGMLPDDRAEVQVLITPPREPGSTAGPHPVKLVARSEQRPAERAVEELMLVIKPFTEFKLAIYPQVRTGRRRGTYLLEVTNKGNQTQPFNLEGIHEEELLDFQWYPRTPIVAPGEVRKSRLRIKRGWRILGNKEVMPFTVTATPSDLSAPPLTVAPRYNHKALIPQWIATRLILPLILLAMAFLTGIPQKLIKSVTTGEPLITSSAGTPVAGTPVANGGGLQPTGAAGTPGANDGGTPPPDGSSQGGQNPQGTTPDPSGGQGQPLPADSPTPEPPTPEPPTPEPPPTDTVEPTPSEDPALITPTETLVPTVTTAPTLTPSSTPVPLPTRRPPVPLAGITHWTLADSPVFLTWDYIVPVGSALLIDPGVQVRIVSNARLIVNGGLHAAGDQTNHVQIKSADGSLWGGIYVGHGGRATLNYTEIRQAGAEGVAIYAEGGELSLNDALISENGGGVVTLDSNVNIQRTIISGNQLSNGAPLAITLGENRSAYLIGNIVTGNQAPFGAELVQISIDTPRTWLAVEGNFFSDSTGPNLLIDSQVPYSANISCNTFRTGPVGLHLKSAVSSLAGFGLSISQNAFEGHANRGVAADLDFVAQNNWWGHPSGPFEGTRNPTGQGNSAGINLIFSPWLSERPSCAPQP